MTKTFINLQDLRRRIYYKAKSDKKHRFWGIFIHITKMETLAEAYKIAKRNNGAPGIDGQTFEDIEAYGVTKFLENIREDLMTSNYKPQKNRKVEIPKENSKVRVLQIPCIRDRVVQGAVKLILEAIFEADFCDNSYGYRPKQSSHRALAEVRRSILRRMTMVVDVDLSKYFDTIEHSTLLKQIAKRVDDSKVMRLLKQILKSSGKVGVQQGGPLSPLAANIYLNEVDWAFDEIRRQTARGTYESVNYHRFSDDIVITVSGYVSKSKWPQRALERLEEELEPLKVTLNKDKTKVVNTLKGEYFSFLGFDIRCAPKRDKEGHFVLLTPKKSARKSVKAKIRNLFKHSGSMPIKQLVQKVNEILTGWANYFRVGNSSRAFSEVRDYTEMQLRTLLTRRKRRRKHSVGWRRWSNEYIYDVLKLYWDWKISHLKSAKMYK